MVYSRSNRRTATLTVTIAACLLAPALAAAQVAPELERSAVSLGQQAPAVPVSGTVWLALHNKSALDAAVAAMYASGSPTYHQFATAAADAQYAPTTAEVTAVQQELAAHHLTVTRTSPNNLSVQFEGQTSDFESAFHTTVQQYRIRNGKMVKAFSSKPALGNSATGLVQAVSGVGGAGMEPQIIAPVDPQTGKLLGVQTLAAAAAETASPTRYCIDTTATTLLTTPGETYPITAYQGPIYGAPLANGKLTSTKECSYTPQQFYVLSGLDTILAQGYTGKGQTIGIVEESGSATIQQDLAAFDQLYHLPAANLTVMNIEGTPTPTTGSEHETTLDVEWAHAVAPDANLVLVVVPSNTVEQAAAYIVDNHLAEIVSSSYGATEQSDTADNITAWNEVCEFAAYHGISVDAASGDYGDRFADEGVVDVNVPADSPYATGVGGVSIVYQSGGTQVSQTGWGTHLTQIGTNGAPLSAPVFIPETKFGSGGGISTIFPKPAYQAALSGPGRHIPDVSAIADPHTGLKIVITDPTNCSTEPCVEVEGGTSLATPVFSAEWALLNQLHGSSLGQAAPLLAEYASTGALTDVLPPPSANVIGAMLNSQGLMEYSADQLGSPQTSSPFLSALWQTTSGIDYVLTFGTDSSLQLGPGWDPVTGYGTLNISGIFSALRAFSPHP